MHDGSCTQRISGPSDKITKLERFCHGFMHIKYGEIHKRNAYRIEKVPKSFNSMLEAGPTMCPKIRAKKTRNRKSNSDSGGIAWLAKIGNPGRRCQKIYPVAVVRFLVSTNTNTIQTYTTRMEVNKCKEIYTQKKYLIESKKLFVWNTFFDVKKFFVLMKQNLFESNKISLDQINICSNQINFCLKSNKLYLWPYINLFISLFCYFSIRSDSFHFHIKNCYQWQI